MILYGAGGHAKVIYDRLQAVGVRIVHLFDDNPAIKSFMNLKVVHDYDSLLYREEKLIIAIGSNAARYELSSKITHGFAIFIDPTAQVSKTSKIGEGSMVLTNAVIHAAGSIGNHCIINTRAILEHDTHIGDFAHVGPGAVICGGATVGNGAFIGANATVLPGIKIGDWSVVGAGAVVTKNVSAGIIVAGNPAKRMSK
ncbi:MAG: acetyltransferase [Cyclobacteriaceae bacterium]|nr:acetyltransferase [Cyclobacteriaceae bacterium]